MASLLVSVHIRVRIHERVSFLTCSRWHEVPLTAQEKRKKNVLSLVQECLLSNPIFQLINVLHDVHIFLLNVFLSVCWKQGKYES